MENIHPQNFSVSKEQRRLLHGHKSIIIWLTGLSGSGKSTIANLLELKLYENQISTFILDGDNLRSALNKDLGFSIKDREENIRRVGEVAKLFIESGTVVLVTFISPLEKDRRLVRELVDQGEFYEVYVKCPLEHCEKRDPKGLYKKARLGQIPEFTGITSPYEEPTNPEIVL
ncbi:MAG: adenylyl-sulfate kinase, partial [Heyndrickxia sp.]